MFYICEPFSWACNQTSRIHESAKKHRTDLISWVSSLIVILHLDMRSIAHSIQLPKFPIVIYFDETCVDVKLDGRKYPLTTKTGSTFIEFSVEFFFHRFFFYLLLMNDSFEIISSNIHSTAVILKLRLLLQLLCIEVLLQQLIGE